MGNLRQLKKNIHNFCDDIVTECALADTLAEEPISNKLAEIVVRTVKLECDTVRKASVNFPKAPRDFSSKAEYNKARRKYYAQAFNSLDTIFFKEVDGILAEFNKVVSKS